LAEDCRRENTLLYSRRARREDQRNTGQSEKAERSGIIQPGEKKAQRGCHQGIQMSEETKCGGRLATRPSPSCSLTPPP